MNYKFLLVIFLAFASAFVFADDHNGSNNGCDGNNKGHHCKNQNPPPTPPPSGGNSSSSSSVSNSGNSSSTSGVKNSGNSSSSSTAYGGSVKDSGNSYNENSNEVSNSGNSSNKLAQSQQQSSASNASDNGNGSNNTTTNVEAPKIPVATAYAASPLPTVPCSKGYGVGVQTGPVGFSANGGKIDENCARLEVARSFSEHRPNKAFCKVMINNKYAKEAGVTYEDCMGSDKPATETVVVPQTSLKTTPKNVEETVVEPLPPVRQLSVITPVGNCDKADNVCKAKLDDAVLFAHHHPEYDLILSSSSLDGAAVANRLRSYLFERGLTSDRVILAPEGNSHSGVTFSFELR